MNPQPRQSGPAYICAECGHGENLEAIASANVSGPLGADGSLAAHVSSEECYVYEETIACTIHGDCVSIHKLIDGRYHRWESCEKCVGHVGKEYASRQRYGFGAQDPPCSACRGRGGRDVPVEDVCHA